VVLGVFTWVVVGRVPKRKELEKNLGERLFLFAPQANFKVQNFSAHHCQQSSQAVRTYLEGAGQGLILTNFACNKGQKQGSPNSRPKSFLAGQLFVVPCIFEDKISQASTITQRLECADERQGSLAVRAKSMQI
jgi:hypothetical protein